MRVTFLLLSIALTLTSEALGSDLDETLITDDLVKQINGANTTWTASAEQGAFFRGATRRQIMRLMGVRKVKGAPELPERSYAHLDATSLPDTFDAATNWPHCSTITQIRDQSCCGSCWAFGAAESISDRYCTYSSTPRNITISANNLVACCDLSSMCGMGCGGGEPSGAWNYWVSTGLVDEACDPYPFAPCEHHTTGKYPPCPDKEYPTPKCIKTCKNNETWSLALMKGTKSWSVKGPAAYQQELYANGPFEVSFTVYDDFLAYKSGVYSHTTGSALGGHAVRLVGWGTLGGVPYWKIANSWNSDWGAQGYFLIKRGDNECGIEKEGNAGQP